MLHMLFLYNHQLNFISFVLKLKLFLKYLILVQSLIMKSKLYLIINIHILSIIKELHQKDKLKFLVLQIFIKSMNFNIILMQLNLI